MATCMRIGGGGPRLDAPGMPDANGVDTAVGSTLGYTQHMCDRMTSSTQVISVNYCVHTSYVRTRRPNGPLAHEEPLEVSPNGNRAVPIDDRQPKTLAIGVCSSGPGRKMV